MYLPWSLGWGGQTLAHWTQGVQGGPSLLSPSTEEVEAPEVEPRLVYCYPVRLAVSAPPMPSVEMHIENNVVCIRYKGEMVKVSRNYFSKLVRAGGRGGGSPQVGEVRAGSLLTQSPQQEASDKGGTCAQLKPPAFCPTVAPLPL